MTLTKQVDSQVGTPTTDLSELQRLQSKYDQLSPDDITGKIKVTWEKINLLNKSLSPTKLFSKLVRFRPTKVMQN